MTCPFCNKNKLYNLENEYKKCSTCKKKFSLKKIILDKKCINLFCNNINARQCSIILNKNYRTVQNRYTIFRKLIASYLENEYNNTIKDNLSYEEYSYTPIREKKKQANLNKSINIIGFYSNSSVYALLMPKLPCFDKESKNTEFKNYLNRHKINSLKSYQTPLNVFWKYLDSNLKKYKGIDESNFFYYLKECEFKFNYLQNRQIKILNALYYENYKLL